MESNMRQLNFKNLKHDEELEQLKGTCDILEDRVCEVMKELLNELDKKKNNKKNSKKKELIKKEDAA